MQIQLRKNIDAAHTYTYMAKQRRKKRLNINTRALDNGNVVIWLFLDFSAGRRVYEWAREILSHPLRLSLHYTGACAH